MNLTSKIGVGVKLTIQIVNFRSREYLSKCLFSILENLSPKIETEVIVINNDELNLADFAMHFPVSPPLRIVELNKNVGFGKANNVTIEKAQGDFIMFLNPDTKILPGALPLLLETMLSDEEIGIVAPILVDFSGAAQLDCFGVEKTPLSTIGRKIFSLKKKNSEIKNEKFEADWVSGGALLIRKDVFRKTGGFDENYFMYFEDVDLCRQVKKMGYRVIVNPAAKVFHSGGKSFKSEKEKKKYYYASQDYYLRKNFGPFQAALVKIMRWPYYFRNVRLKR